MGTITKIHKRINYELYKLDKVKSLIKEQDKDQKEKIKALTSKLEETELMRDYYFNKNQESVKNYIELITEETNLIEIMRQEMILNMRYQY